MTQPTPVRVLLVEDDRKLAAMVIEFLQQHGFEVSHEVRGDHAETRIVKEQPDLVILDVMLPGKDGLTVCRQVRPDPCKGSQPRQAHRAGQ